MTRKVLCYYSQNEVFFGKTVSVVTEGLNYLFFFQKHWLIQKLELKHVKIIVRLVRPLLA